VQGLRFRAIYRWPSLRGQKFQMPQNLRSKRPETLQRNPQRHLGIDKAALGPGHPEARRRHPLRLVAEIYPCVLALPMPPGAMSHGCDARNRPQWIAHQVPDLAPAIAGATLSAPSMRTLIPEVVDHEVAGDASVEAHPFMPHAQSKPPKPASKVTGARAWRTDDEKPARLLLRIPHGSDESQDPLLPANRSHRQNVIAIARGIARLDGVPDQRK